MCSFPSKRPGGRRRRREGWEVDLDEKGARPIRSRVCLVQGKLFPLGRLCVVRLLPEVTLPWSATLWTAPSQARPSCPLEPPTALKTQTIGNGPHGKALCRLRIEYSGVRAGRFVCRLLRPMFEKKTRDSQNHGTGRGGPCVSLRSCPRN